MSVLIKTIINEHSLDNHYVQMYKLINDNDDNNDNNNDKYVCLIYSVPEEEYWLNVTDYNTKLEKIIYLKSDGNIQVSIDEKCNKELYKTIIKTHKKYIDFGLNSENKISFWKWSNNKMNNNTKYCAKELTKEQINDSIIDQFIECLFLDEYNTKEKNNKCIIL